MATKQEKRDARQSHVKFKAKYAVRDPQTRQFGDRMTSTFSVPVGVFNTNEKVAGCIETIAAATHKVPAADVLCYNFINRATEERFAIDGETIRRRTEAGKPKPTYPKPTAEQIDKLKKPEILEAVGMFELDGTKFDPEAPVAELRKALKAELAE